jgi:transglutaminase-like putative cysteine protease
VGGLLGLYPETVFTAISARGDWMLGEREDPSAASVRKFLFATADRLEWVYNLAHDNPYEQYEIEEDEDPTPVVSTRPDAAIAVAIAEDQPDAAIAIAEDKPDAGTAIAVVEDKPPVVVEEEPAVWPLPDAQHSAAANIPAEAETAIASVAAFIASQEPSPQQRVKAIHDYIATRISYDDVALAAGQYPPQDAETVFRTKKAVCAGYSRLFVEMTKHVGIKAVYVTGEVRDESAEIAGESHAWNAVELDGQWFLVDVTWGSPNMLSGNKPGAALRSDYLLTPPEVFGLDHFPKKDEWQLRATPLSRGEFIRQPMLAPKFHRERLSLIAPDRSQIDAEGDRLDVLIENPLGRYMMASFVPAQQSEGDGVECAGGAARGSRLELSCKFPEAGVFRVRMFANDEQYGQYAYVGQINVTRR